jgi:TonB family protein
MNEMWKRWEGRTVNGKFPLQTYVGGSDHSAVFLTSLQGRHGETERAAIKLIAVDGEGSEDQLKRWSAARELSHPHLIRIFDMGHATVDGTSILYVVQEYAEENLSQILPERALTVEETRALLPPVLRALQFLQDKGLAHGRIQPSNIMAIGEQVKLSSDAVGPLGERRAGARTSGAFEPPEAATGTISTAGDVWQLGAALVEVLTQRRPVWDSERSSNQEVPTNLPEPFREVASRCLQFDAEKRCTIAEISNGLTRVAATTETADSGPAVARMQPTSGIGRYLLAGAAIVALAFVLIPRFISKSKPADSVSEARSVESKSISPAQIVQPATPSPESNAQGRASGIADSKGADSANADSQAEVVKRVVPEVSSSARRRIRGTIQVGVKVKVDAAGNVAKAKVASGRANRYFKHAALAAAQDWKFAPAQTGDLAGNREWKLQFAFSRSKTEASAVRADR